jgi:DNA polymerase-3 subunit gamma/tau
MAPETVRSHLANVLSAESVPADAGALHLIARAARGSLRDALSLTDQAIAFGAGRLEEGAVRQMLGSADRALVFALIDALARGDGQAVVATCDTLREQGLNPASALEEMSAVVQRMAVRQALPAARSADADADDPDAAEITRLAQAMPADETQLLYSICLHGRQEIGLAPDEYAGLVMVLLRLLAFKPAGQGTAQGATQGAVPLTPSSSAPAEKKSLKQAEVQASPASTSPRPDPRPDPIQASHPAQRPGRVLPVVDAPPRANGTAGHGHANGGASQGVNHGTHNAAASPVMSVPVKVQAEAAIDRAASRDAITVVPTPEGDFWAETVQGLIAAERVAALVRELALQSQLVGRDEHDWLLRVERESLNQGNNRERLQAALQAAGHPVTLAVEIGPVTDSPARRIAAAQAERQRQAEQIILGDPFVQAMMRDFGAKIVPGSIKPAGAAPTSIASNPSKDS